jgi:4-hydroxybenzoyl-CoA thioesterase
MSSYQKEVQVRFGHCDPATFVYYPRYFEMLNGFIEDWFEEGLEASFPGLMHHQNIMAPTVHLDTDFPNPSRFGDRLTFKLQVTKIGRSSVNLEIEGSCQGQPRVTFKQTLVFMSASDRKAVAIPPDIVHRLKRYLVDATRKQKQTSD